MSATTPANFGACVAEPSTSEHLSVHVSNEGDQRVVWVTGELDAASREQLASAAAGDHPAMVVDLAGVTFMDCGGYGSLATTRLAIEGAGRTLTTRGQTGQPGRLFDLIASLEDRRCSPGMAETSGTRPDIAGDAVTAPDRS